MAWTAREAAIAAARAVAEDALSDATRQLEALRENAGATEQDSMGRLAALSRENEALKRRVRDAEAVRARLAEAEARGEFLIDDGRGGNLSRCHTMHPSSRAVVKLRDDAFAGEMARRALHNTVQVGG